jgi:hypothetical protein
VPWHPDQDVHDGFGDQIRHGRAAEVFDAAASWHHANKPLTFIDEPDPLAGVVLAMAHLRVGQKRGIVGDVDSPGG